MEVQQGLQACENWDNTQNGKEDSNKYRWNYVSQRILCKLVQIANKRWDYVYFILPPN